MKYLLPVLSVLVLATKVLSEKVECSPFIKAHGYQCCEAPCVIEYTDTDGYWGIQNGRKCGCGVNELNLDMDCSDVFKNQGYQCCNNCDVYYKDNDGLWGIRDGDWCGISDACTKYKIINDYS